MNTKLKRVEVETRWTGDNDLSIKYTARRKLLLERLDHFRKVPVERFLIAALDHDLVSVAKDESAEAIPLGLEDPGVAFGDRVDAFCKHGRDGRRDRKVHGTDVIPTH